MTAGRRSPLLATASGSIASTSPLDQTGTGPGTGWAPGVWIVLAMLGIVAIKIHELVPGIGVIRPALLITVGGIVVLMVRTPNHLIRRSLDRPLPKLLLAYFAWCILTVPTSVWPSQSIDALLSLVPLALLVVAVVILPPTLANTDRLQFWWVVVFAAYGLFGRAAAYAGGRLEFGFTYDSNDIAALMSIGFPLALGISLRSSGRRRLFAIIATIVCVVTIVDTRSRGGFLGLAAGALALAMATRGTRRINILIILVLGGLLTWSTASPGFRNRMISITNLENDYNTTSEVGRKAVWARGRQYIRQNPVLGVGVGNFSTAEGMYWQAAGTPAKWSNAHNAYIQAYAELGIPGGTLFVAIVALGLVVAWRLSMGVMLGGEISRRPEYFASVVSFAVSAVFLSHAYFPTFFGLIAFIALLEHTVVRSGGAFERFPGPATTAPRIVRTPGQRGGHAYTVVRNR